ncbi:MAG: PBSX family phage terminase large subunit [Oscillospiraceae bacterium]
MEVFCLADFKRFSPKQKTVLTWWRSERYKSCDAVICDGAVRSGKTLCMSISFAAWAMANFNGGVFAVCGKTVTSLKRNVAAPLLSALRGLGFSCVEKVSGSYADISAGGRTNRFYFFGGRDEGSAALIQGITLCGVLLDEVVLMPRSFVEQALARCSVEGSKLWFSCNPSYPYHWFYREWILKAREKNALYLHFTMDDNPSLSDEVRERYRRLYSGVFYDRFVLGKWVAAEGLVYPMFSEKRHIAKTLPEQFERFAVSCDYGTVNPSSFGLWGKCGETWYRIGEYYYSSKREGMSRTDEEHYEGLRKLIGGRAVDGVIVDPSAASFIECIRRHGEFPVIAAKNDVVSGIRRCSDALRDGRIMFAEGCADILREFSLYRWDESRGGDVPVKENDHAMDDMRYFVTSSFFRGSECGFWAGAVKR